MWFTRFYTWQKTWIFSSFLEGWWRWQWRWCAVTSCKDPESQITIPGHKAVPTSLEMAARLIWALVTWVNVTGGISWDFTGFLRHPIAGHGWPRFQPATLLDFSRMRVHVNVSCRDHGICIALGSLEDSSVCLERSMVTWALITGPIGLSCLSSSAILGSYQRLAADNTATCTYLHIPTCLPYSSCLNASLSVKPCETKTRTA